jgi:hypothetical protein
MGQLHFAISNSTFYSLDLENRRAVATRASNTDTGRVFGRCSKEPLSERGGVPAHATTAAFCRNRWRTPKQKSQNVRAPCNSDQGRRSRRGARGGAEGNRRRAGATQGRAAEAACGASGVVGGLHRASPCRRAAEGGPVAREVLREIFPNAIRLQPEESGKHLWALFVDEVDVIRAICWYGSREERLNVQDAAVMAAFGRSAEATARVKNNSSRGTLVALFAATSATKKVLARARLWRCLLRLPRRRRW